MRTLQIICNTCKDELTTNDEYISIFINAVTSYDYHQHCTNTTPLDTLTNNLVNRDSIQFIRHEPFKPAVQS